MIRRVLTVVTALVALAALVGCGRELPADEEENVPAGGDPTGAFGEPAGAAGARVRIEGVPAAVAFGRAALHGFRTEEPETDVVLKELDAVEAATAVCSGKTDVAGLDRELSGEERTSCEGTQEGAVELQMAKANGKPVYFVTTQKALFDKLELESYLDYVLANAVATARQAGQQPLSIEELDETQTRLERGVAGVG